MWRIENIYWKAYWGFGSTKLGWMQFYKAAETHGMLLSTNRPYAIKLRRVMLFDNRL